MRNAKLSLPELALNPHGKKFGPGISDSTDQDGNYLCLEPTCEVRLDSIPQGNDPKNSPISRHGFCRACYVKRGYHLQKAVKAALAKSGVVMPPISRAKDAPARKRRKKNAIAVEEEGDEEDGDREGGD